MARTEEAAREIARGIREDAAEEAAHRDYTLSPGDLDVIEGMAVYVALNRPDLDPVQIADVVWPIYDDLHTTSGTPAVEPVIPIDTIEGAQAAVRSAVRDTAGDQGNVVADAGYTELVRAVAADCIPDVAAELLRREGLGEL